MGDADGASAATEAPVAPVRFVDPGEKLADELVRIRRWRPSDAPRVHAACQDPEIGALIPPIPIPYGPADAEAFVTSSVDCWTSGLEATFAIADPQTDDVLGAIALHPRGPERWEIGYWVAPWARRRGVATHAVRLLAPWAMRTYGLVRLALVTLDGNIASQAVATASGFQLEGTLRNGIDVRGRPVGAVTYSLVPGDAALQGP